MTASAPTKLTYDDYASFPDDGRRHELIDGEHYVSPSPIRMHQAILLRLTFALLKHLEGNPSGTLFQAPFDVVLSDVDVVQPDLLYIAREHESIITEKNIHGAPDLVIEVLSESTRRTDEITKRRLYERFGVREYWIIDPVLETVKIYRLTDSRYERIAEISNETGGRLDIPMLPGFAMDLAVLFRD